MKKKSYGIAIDSKKADAAHYPKMAPSVAGAKSSVSAPAEQPFGKKRARKQRVAIMLSKARKGS